MDLWDEHPRTALHAYLDGELSLEGSLSVEDHLAACELCRRERETLGALHRALRSKRTTPGTHRSGGGSRRSRR
jgi:anti-sigma factor RsiW